MGMWDETARTTTGAQTLCSNKRQGLQGIIVRSVDLRSDAMRAVCLRMADSKFTGLNVCVAFMADNQSPDA